MTFNSGCW